MKKKIKSSGTEVSKKYTQGKKIRVEKHEIKNKKHVIYGLDWIPFHFY